MSCMVDCHRLSTSFEHSTGTCYLVLCYDIFDQGVEVALPKFCLRIVVRFGLMFLAVHVRTPRPDGDHPVSPAENACQFCRLGFLHLAAMFPSTKIDRMCALE